MDNQDNTQVNSVLVVGAGIAGIRAALELAESQHYVYLLDATPYIGGTLSQLEKQFPSNDCGICKILPSFGNEASEFCFRRGVYHKNIELITSAELVECKGHAGDFKVTIRKRPETVEADKCIACDACTPVCEVEVKDESNKLNSRKAIYIKNPLAFPNVYTIDENHCNECGKCVDICPTNAIDLSAKETRRELSVGAIVLGIGFEKINPDIKKEYGHEHYENVITNIELERSLAAIDQPGNFSNAINKESPRIAFIQCVGSRERDRNYCSASCCMIALKEAIMLKEMNPDIQVTIFFMDLRAYGKGYHRYYKKAQDLGVRFLRCRAPAIEEESEKTLKINYMTEDEKLSQEQFDLVVLSVGQSPSLKMKSLSNVLGIELSSFDFCKTLPFASQKTTKEGILACGSITAPKDIGKSVTDAVAAAAQSSQFLDKPSDSDEEKDDDNKPSMGEEPQIGIFLCKCGKEISSAINFEDVVDFSKSRGRVCFVKTMDYLCVDLDEIKKTISGSDANRIVFASCAPYNFEQKFKKVLDKAGIDNTLFEIVNLREQVSCAHTDKMSATEKAKAQVQMAVAKLGSLELESEIKDQITQKALVLGGGIAGMSAALTIANNGIEVDLVEKAEALGGILKEIHYTVERQDAQLFLKETIKSVVDHPLIHIQTNAELETITGHAGNFSATLTANDEKQFVDAGAVIISTGAKAYQPNQYEIGNHPDIITQKDLETSLAEKGDLKADSIVMIQCVGSREQDSNNYCSKICCTEAVKNILRIKETNPRAEIYLLYRDIMTYGLKEEFYRKARESGVFLIRYTKDEKPLVSTDQNEISVSVVDHILRKRLVIKPDLLVLSTGILPNEDNVKVSKMLGLNLDEDGFFLEANPKFRPVDFVKEGIFVCGTAHSPMDISEAITQANAAAGRALTLLSKKEMKSKKIVSEVVDRRCAACEVCIDACPYDARIVDHEKGVVKVMSTLCQGCGVCATVCPNGASKMRGFSAKQMLSMIDVAVA